MTQISVPSDVLTFMILGAQKAGTTWLYELLSQHPDIFLPEEKELHFYNRCDAISEGYEPYLKHFEGAENHAMVGEATPNYLSAVCTEQERLDPIHNTEIPATIHSDLPDISFVVSLRNPINRAVSAFHHLHTRAHLPLNANLRDNAETFGILSFGFYAEHLEKYFEYYPEDRFCLVIFEEDILPKDAKRKTIDRVCAHLNVAPLPETVDLNIRSNEKMEPAMAYLNRAPLVRDNWRAKKVASTISRWVPNQINQLIEPTVSQEDRDFLAETFAPHNKKLEELLGKKLPW